MGDNHPIRSIAAPMQLLTPKQVALATGTSESSIKRWCDKGVISTQYTVGGHRRITMQSLLGFLRESPHQLVEPQQVGLPIASISRSKGPEDSVELLASAMLDGDEHQCRSILLNLYLAQHSFAVICDVVITGALTQIGDAWHCGSADIYQERHGCGILSRLLGEMSNWIAAPPSTQPLALGSAIECDPYTLPSQMVELTLRENGWRANSLGNNLPFSTCRRAIRAKQPKLYWLCARSIDNVERFVAEYNEFFAEVSGDVAIVVGGRALDETVRTRIKYSAYCDNLQHLEVFVSKL